MTYQQRISTVLDYIGKHLDAELTLEQLSDVAYFSKYHFHRLFTAHTGLSLSQYIKWLRLKRAAHQLIIEQDKPIIDIALDAGFESHQSFSRAFKQSCGQSPSDFRFSLDWHKWETAPHSLPRQGEKIMNVTIKDLPARRLAAIQHKGDPQKVGETVSRLIVWAKAQTISLKPEPGDAFCLTYGDPKTMPAEEFRCDFALTVPEQFTLTGEVLEKRLPAGRYAVVMHRGSRNNIDETIYSLYRDWLPDSGEEPADLPCLFCYYNFDHEVAETELLTEVWVLLK